MRFPRELRAASVVAIAFAIQGCAKSSAHPSESSSPAALSASARSSAQGPAPSLPSNLSVLLITVDALRADMPWVGYPRNIAPNLTKLAEKSVVYTRAYALSSYTSMSLGGMLASRYPLELPRDGRATSRFFDDALFFPELLKPAGIRTIAAHGHVYFAGDTGIAQGFEDWRVIPGIVYNPAREGYVSDAAISELMQKALGEHGASHPGQRFFAWVHFMDPHFDYANHTELERYRGSPYAADAGAVPPGSPLDSVGQQLRNRYDREVAFTDSQIGRLLAWVDAQPWAKTTAIVVTSDHGEAFGEHEHYFEHGFFLFDVTTRVPLLLRIPGVAPRRIDARRSHIDLGPTLLDLFGVPKPPSMRGQSLLSEMAGNAPPAPRDIVIDMPYTDQTPRRRALIHGKFKLIASESELKPQLYDLDADPGERHDLAAERPELASELDARLKELDAKIPDYPAERRAKREY